MPAQLIRVEEGPIVRDGVVVVERGQWAVLSLVRVPDPDDVTTPLDPGTVRAVCGSEQEAERVARELIFGPAGDSEPIDVLDTLPEGDPAEDSDEDPDADWDIEQLEDEEDEGDEGESDE
jgi:hypothetical protein